MKSEKMIDLKKKIIAIYENDPRVINKINLDIQASNLTDQNLENLKSEIYDSIKNRFNENLGIEEDIEEFESASPDYENDTIFDLSLLEKIDTKVLSILQYVNIGLFSKEELKEKIINDMLDYLYGLSSDDDTKNKILSRIPVNFLKNDLSEKLSKINDYELKRYLVLSYPKRKDNIERTLNYDLNDEDRIKLWFLVNSIPWYIENHIDHEFKEYELKKRQIHKELLSNLLAKIKPEMLSFFDDHQKNRLKKINKAQIENFMKFVFDYFDDKYIKVDKKNKKLNNDDYLFLKSKIKRFIMESYINRFLKGIS